MGKTKLGLGLLFCLGVTANAGEFSIGLDVHKSKFDGNFQYKGTSIDSKNILGMDKKDTVVIPKIKYTTGNHSFSLSYEGSKYEGSKVLTASIEFNNKIYSASAKVDSKIETDWYQLGYRYNLGTFFDRVNLAVGTDINVIDLEASIDTVGISESYDQAVAFPTIALDTNIKLFENLDLHTSLSGIPLGSYGHYIEYDAGFTVEIPSVENFEFNIGYKGRKIDIEDGSDKQFDLDWSGIYAGINYKF